MCLIVLAWRTDPTFDVLLAANRDEFHERPTEAAHWWSAPDGLFAGRDRRAGGAWCGADRRGRFAAVTNVREPDTPAGQYSRGQLVRDYFAGSDSAASWAAHVADRGAQFSPFNLIVGDVHELYFVSNRDERRYRRLRPGIVAISNGHWGEHWPKTERAEYGLRRRIKTSNIEAEALFDLLADAEPAAFDQLPDTGIDRDKERFLSPMFIQSAAYGTRASTVIRRRGDQDIAFDERSFDHNGEPVHRVRQYWFVETVSHETNPPLR